MNRVAWVAVGACVGVVLTLILEARPAQQRAHQAEACLKGVLAEVKKGTPPIREVTCVPTSSGMDIFFIR